MGGAAENRDGDAMNDEDDEARGHLDNGKTISRLTQYHSVDDDAIREVLRSRRSQRENDRDNTCYNFLCAQ